MTNTEKMQKRAKLLNDIREFVDTHEDENGKMSAENFATYERMEDEYKSLSDSIKRQEAIDARDKELSKPATEPILPTPAKVDDKTGTASKEYEDAYSKMCLCKFESGKLSAVQNVMQEGVDEDGGYLVPDEWDSKIAKKLDDTVVMRQLGTVFKTQHGTHKLPMYTDVADAVWMAENSAFEYEDDSFGELEFGAHKLGKGLKISDELLADNAYNIDAFMQDRMAMKLARGEEAGFLTGNGTNKPVGIFDATGGGEYVGTADVLNFDKIIYLRHALRTAYRPKASFLMADSIYEEIEKLKDNNGQYLLQPSLVLGQPDTIRGYAVHVSDYAPEGKIAFGDFSYYWIADRGNRVVKPLYELFAGNGQVGLLTYERVDGKLTIREAVKVMGTPTTAAKDTKIKK